MQRGVSILQYVCVNLFPSLAFGDKPRPVMAA